MQKRFLARVFSLILIASLMFAFGCENAGIGQKKTGIVKEEIYSGTKGLEMKFLDNLPPSKLYDTASLDIVAELYNRGIYDLNNQNCILHLHGFDSNIFRGLDRNKFCGDMKAKSIEYFQGEKNTVEFKTDTIELMEGIDHFPQKFVITACYDYQTIATPVVCVDPTYYRVTAVKGACTAKDVSLAGGQGAPVAVTRVGVNMMGQDKVSFEIDIKNVGGGNVLRNGIDLYNTCPHNINYEDYDIVEYDINMGKATRVRCAPEIEGAPRVRLTNGEARIICSFSVSEENAYTTPLDIWLGYSYMDSISKSVEIIKTPG